MNRRDKKILAWRRQGWRVWAIADHFLLSEAEVARVLLANGYQMQTVAHPIERKPTKVLT